MPSKLTPMRRAGRVVALGLTLALAVVGQPAKAQVGFEAGISKFPNPTWGTNKNPTDVKKSGQVWDIVEHNGIAYLGGEFTSIAPSVELAGAVDGASGLPASGFPTVSGGVVNVSVPDGTGGWYLGGDFTALNEYGVNGLAHILADGSIDTGWDASLAGAPAQDRFRPGAHFRVWGLARMGSYLYVGGEFARFTEKFGNDSATRNRIARVSAFTGTVDQGWDPGADNTVRGLAPSPDGRRVYIAGDFGTVGGQARNGLASVNDGGLVEPWAPSFPGADAVVVSSDNSRIYAGGNGVAGFDTNGSPLWPAVGGSGVRGIALSRNNSILYVGGDFASLGGASRRHLGAVNAITGGLDASWAPEVTKGSSSDCTGGVPAVSGVSVSEDGKKVFVGGCFSAVRTKERHFLAAIDSMTGTLESWNPGATGAVTSLSVSGAQVYAGGRFTSLGASPRAMLAAIDMSNGRSTNWVPQLQNDEPGVPPVIQAMALSTDASKIYIAGNFSHVLGANGFVPRENLAAVDINTGLVVESFNPGTFQGTVRSLLMFALPGQAPKLYVGGDFSSIRVSATDQSGTRSDRPCDGRTGCTPEGNKGETAKWDRKGLMAALNPDTGVLDLGFGLAVDATPGVGLIGQGGKQCSGDVCGDGAVRALAASADGRYLYAGGTFSDMNGQLGLISLNLPAGTPTSWQPKIDIPAFDLDIFKGDGKSLFMAGGGAGGSMERFLPHEGPETPTWKHKYDGDSVAVDSSLTTVYNGGHYDFVDSGTYKRKHASAFNVNGEIAVNFDPELDTTTGPFTLEVITKGDGTGWVAYGGEFSRVNRVPQPGYAQFPGRP